MAGYFTVDNAFWSDSDIAENFTPEDKYFYLYLLTCPYANISGCYEISLKQMSYDTGYSKETVERLLDRFITIHRVVDYNRETKEMLVCNWGKYHWTTSEKYQIALRKRIDSIKTEKFKKYLNSVLEKFKTSTNGNTVWIPYRNFQYGMDTSFTSTYTLSSPEPIKEEIGVQGEEEKPKPQKKAKKEQPLGVFEEFAGEDAELLEALKEYEKMRNGKRKPMTEHAKTLLVNKLRDKYPPHQWVAIVDQSTLKGWDSVYPLKDDEDWGGRNRGKGKNDGNVFFQNAREIIANEYVGN